ANEGASTSSYNNKSLKRKTFVDLKDEEGSLFKGRIHVNKVDPDQKLINKMGSMGEHERQTKVPPLANQVSDAAAVKKVLILHSSNLLNFIDFDELA
ncbi:hypothetical protein Tco_1480344, partial [Tanacetum coccineum]